MAEAGEARSGLDAGRHLAREIAEGRMQRYEASTIGLQPVAHLGRPGHNTYLRYVAQGWHAAQGRQAGQRAAKGRQGRHEQPGAWQAGRLSQIKVGTEPCMR